MEKVYTCYYDKSAYESFNLPGIIFLKNNDSFCFYDEDTNMFYGSDLQPFDISDKFIIPYCHSNLEDAFCKTIQEQGGIIPYGIDHIYDTLAWPLVYKTKRKSEVTTGELLIDLNNLDLLEKKYGSELFFKTLSKNYSNKVKINDLKNDETLIHTVLSMHKDEEFIISELVDVESDDIGTKEYRVIVFDNNILSISRNTYFILHEIDFMVYETTKMVVEKMKGKNFPSSYVLDLFEYKDKNGQCIIDVLEFNPICSSGKYLYNSVSYLPASDMLHKDVRNIAIELRRLIDFCELPSLEYKNFLSTSVYYGEKGSFANDLKKVNNFGSFFDLGDDIDLGRNVRKYIDSLKNDDVAVVTNDKSTGFILRELMGDFAKLRIDAKALAEEAAKKIFMENLSLTECPIDVKYIRSDYIFTNDLEISKAVRTLKKTDK